MQRHRLLLGLVLSVNAIGLSSSACSGKGDSQANERSDRERGQPKANAKLEPAEKPVEQSKPAPLGSLRDDVPLPLSSLLAKSSQVTEQALGPHVDKGGVRESCIRFLDKRIWFRCHQVWQAYADPSGTFERVRVVYEDGVTSAVALESPHGSGPVTPEALLAIAGLDLPGKPTQSQPAPGVTLWSFYNNAARLKIDGRQYRVEVSTVNQEWPRSKIEVILNDPLTDDEKARVIERRAETTATGTKPQNTASGTDAAKPTDVAPATDAAQSADARTATAKPPKAP